MPITPAKQLRKKVESLEATRIYHNTGDHEVVAQEMHCSLKEAYNLVDDGIDRELEALRTSSSEDISALHLHEYNNMRGELHSLLQEYKDEKDKKGQLTIITALTKVLQAMDSHCEKTGKFIKKTEMHFSWDEAQGDPELQNLWLAVKDWIRNLECPECGYHRFEPQDFFAFVNDQMHRARTDTVVDVESEDVKEDK